MTERDRKEQAFREAILRCQNPEATEHDWNDLVNDHLMPMARAVVLAKRGLPSAVDYDDLISEVLRFLWLAVVKFDADKPTRAINYFTKVANRALFRYAKRPRNNRQNEVFFGIRGENLP